jgi:hypothetical protein
MYYEKMKKGRQVSPSRGPISPLIKYPLIYGFFIRLCLTTALRSPCRGEKPVNQGDIYEGENAQGGGTYFQPISYLGFLGIFGLSLSSHNSSEKKVGLGFMKLAA